MKIVRSEYIYIIPDNGYERSYVSSLLNKRLIHENPKFAIKNRKKSYGYSEPERIQTFEEVRFQDKASFKISRGNFDIIETIKQDFQSITFEDKRASYRIRCESTAKPRDEEQQKAIDSFVNNNFNYGILNSPPGSGKTFIASQLITKYKERTLILVDMNLLIEQFVDSLLAFTDIKEEEIGYIRGQELIYDLDKKVIIATMQTLIRKPEIMKKLNNNIGFLIQDECQIASCDTVRNIFKNFRPKYQIGLSGTPFRDDGMDFLIREMIGPITYTTNKKSMVDKGNLIVPLLRPVFLKDDLMFEKYINKESEIEFRDVVNYYYNNPLVVNKVCKFICKLFNEHSQLVICKEKELVYKYYEELLKLKFPKVVSEYNDFIKEKLERLKEELKKENDEKKFKKLQKEFEKTEKEKIYKSVFIKRFPEVECIKILTGEMKREERNEIIENTNNGKIKVIITTSLLDKAISINRLDILHLLFSTRERANTGQRVGRISRAFDGKKNAIVFDYIYDHYMSFFQFYNTKGTSRMVSHNEFTKIPNNISIFIKYLLKRFMEKNKDIKDKEYDKIKGMYEININE